MTNICKLSDSKAADRKNKFVDQTALQDIYQRLPKRFGRFLRNNSFSESGVLQIPTYNLKITILVKNNREFKEVVGQ